MSPLIRLPIEASSGTVVLPVVELWNMPPELTRLAAALLATDVFSGYPTPGTPTSYVNAVLRFVVFFLITWIVTAIKSALDREKALARIDALTGVMNARMFAELRSTYLPKQRQGNTIVKSMPH
jgi:GGDEF domain-containing protein